MGRILMAARVRAQLVGASTDRLRLGNGREGAVGPGGAVLDENVAGEPLAARNTIGAEADQVVPVQLGVELLSHSASLDLDLLDGPADVGTVEEGVSPGGCGYLLKVFGQ